MSETEPSVCYKGVLYDLIQFIVTCCYNVQNAEIFITLRLLSCSRYWRNR